MSQDFYECEDEYYNDEFDRCDVCGSDDGDGCPFCRPCSGSYAPGTEECDWCPDSEECAQDYMKRFG